jgi:Xaa-Pro aminopeptidase
MIKNFFLVPLVFFAFLNAMEQGKSSAIKNTFSVSQEYRQRREKLIQDVYKKHNEKGIIALFGVFEKDYAPFRQEGFFHRYAGLSDSGLVMTIQQDGETTLFAPNYSYDRSLWASNNVSKKEAEHVGIQQFKYLGDTFEDSPSPLCSEPKSYENLLSFLKKQLQEKKKIYSINSITPGHETDHVTTLRNLMKHIPEMEAALVDIHEIVADLRKTKTPYEIEKMLQAAAITKKAFELAAKKIKPGVTEAKIKGVIESVFTSNGATPGYPSIVGSGINSTCLHHEPNPDSVLQEGDLVLIDIGAENDRLMADITRTFPVSGTFSPRQKEIYEIVLAAQEQVAKQAKPGTYIRNAEKPEKSLYHIAYEFLKEKGYASYFLHGIGHYLGYDVHDVQGYTELKKGDVITIEPGIYIPPEKIGIRIEDNYVITPDGVYCLSKDLPKKPEEIELMMKKNKSADNR